MPRKSHHRALLAGLSTSQFLTRHWQKKPLLVRQAIPNFAGLLDGKRLVELACRPEARARVVIKHGKKWDAYTGPFKRAFLRALPRSGWSLLVNDVNHVVPQAHALLRSFDFIPSARFDDVMVSFAPIGAGVGPHYDSYDVFLLQGPGRRRWQLSKQRDRSLVDGAPLRILRDFQPEEEWVLEPGDMLYLPPGWCHNGVAVDPCMTYSIGFRAPAWQEVAVGFLRHLEDHLSFAGGYRDPGRKPTRHTARLPADMVKQTVKALTRLRWTERDIANFLGLYLSEPKPAVYYTPPASPLSRSQFAARARDTGVTLDLKTQLFYSGSTFFINGEAAKIQGRAAQSLYRLADTGLLSAVNTNERGLVAVLHEWYGAGYIELRTGG
jgi:50S ribosomal protein L16 3-hydroxylase